MPEPPPPPTTRRPALWLLLVPVVLYCLAPIVANRVEPRIFGLPFLIFWVIAATGNDPLWGVNGGLIALVPNVIVTVAVSLARPHTPAPARTRAATPAS